MPDDWSWRQADRLSADRLEQMRRYCNRFWQTVDTPETIFLEYVFQTLIRTMVVHDSDPDASEKRRLQAEYAEFLGLPLDVYNHSPLTFAIAHTHSQNMCTGWPPSPTSLQDRQDARNNILIETRTSNSLKFYFDEATYPLLKKLVQDIQMPLELGADTS